MKLETGCFMRKKKKRQNKCTKALLNYMVYSGFLMMILKIILNLKKEKKKQKEFLIQLKKCLSAVRSKMVKYQNNSILYGLLAGVLLIVFYLAVVSFFQGVEFAFLNLRSLWYLIIPLAVGFGTQVGLFFSIKHTAQLTGAVAGTGTISGGSMVACCSHFLLQMIPFAGASGLAIFLVNYQKLFLGVGILSNVIGI